MRRLLKKNQLLTIPNLLSLFRLCLIPVIICLYVSQNNKSAAAIIIVLSGITDVADGIIARKFNMISDFGKILDPIADKFTQGTIIICLSFEYPLMLPLVIFFILKETVMSALGAVTLKKYNSVNSAKWHGKVNTVILYTSFILLLFFPGLSEASVDGIIILCTISMLTSLALYSVFYIKLWNTIRHANDNEVK